MENPGETRVFVNYIHHSEESGYGLFLEFGNLGINLDFTIVRK